MKKLFGILLVLGVGIVLVACEIRATPIPEIICEPEYSASLTELTIEVLGEIIVSHGSLWTDFRHEASSRSLIVQSGWEEWETAEHTLIEQDGKHAIVQTRIRINNTLPDNELLGYEVYQFTFVGDRINQTDLIHIERVAPEPDVVVPMVGDYYLVTNEFETEDYADTLITFGGTIDRAGAFWEEWWHLTGRFSSENIDFEVEVPEHLEGFNRLLPSSGFVNLAHLRIYLTNYFTDGWINVALFGQDAVFVQYHDNLYVNTTRVGIVRPDWTTTEHELIKKDGNFATVATRVSIGAWQPELTNPADVTFTFGLVNGRIDTNDPRLIWFEMP